MSEKMTRREFFRTGNNLAVGAAAAVYLLPVELGTIIATEAVTDFAGGNAGIHEQKERACEDAPDVIECQDEYVPPLSDHIEGIIEAPLFEEGAFRALPSQLLNELPGTQETTRPIAETFNLSRREWIAGIASSLIFATYHNYTREGFNTQTIPAPQFVSGLAYWWLQRKKGVSANVAAHMAGNALSFGAYHL